MKKFITSILHKLLKGLEDNKETTSTINNVPAAKQKIIPKKTRPLTSQKMTARDVAEMMEVPFLALSKDRKTPIIYETKDSGVRVKITPHSGHFLASIYDWDIILFVANKIQTILNTGDDIPPRTIIIPRLEMIKALKKHDGKKEENDIKASLARLRLTGIETTIRNEDGRYDAGFGFLDSWSYTSRKDKKEISITLSQWLYDGICAKGSLLKVDSEYFNITSGLKKFLYRTARKHVGGHSQTFEFAIETIYEKSGSARDFRKFKSDLKRAVKDNDIYGFDLEWRERDKKCFILFRNIKKQVYK